MPLSADTWAMPILRVPCTQPPQCCTTLEFVASLSSLSSWANRDLRAASVMESPVANDQPEQHSVVSQQQRAA